MKKIIYLILSLIVASSVSFAGAPDGGKGPVNPGGRPEAPTPLDPQPPQLPIKVCHTPLIDLWTGQELPAELTVSSGALCIDFRPAMIGVANITLQNLTTGEMGSNNYYYYTSLVNVPYSGNGGTWLVTIETLDGSRYCGSFYSSAPVDPGAGDAPENFF